MFYAGQSGGQNGGDRDPPRSSGPSAGPAVIFCPCPTPTLHCLTFPSLQRDADPPCPPQQPLSGPRPRHMGGMLCGSRGRGAFPPAPLNVVGRFKPMFCCFMRSHFSEYSRSRRRRSRECGVNPHDSSRWPRSWTVSARPSRVDVRSRRSLHCTAGCLLAGTHKVLSFLDSIGPCVVTDTHFTTSKLPSRLSHRRQAAQPCGAAPPEQSMLSTIDHSFSRPIGRSRFLKRYPGFLLTWTRSRRITTGFRLTSADMLFVKSLSGKELTP